MGMSLCQEKLNKGWADKYSGKENKIEVDLHLQCLLLRAKANALRLNELSLTDFMHIMALTPTRLREIQVHTGAHTARHQFTHSK